jgi:hypothetical protein
MTYTIHQYDEQRGWNLSKFSQSLADFDSMNDQWAFNHILKNGNEYIKMGDTMWTIEWNQNNKEQN